MEKISPKKIWFAVFILIASCWVFYKISQADFFQKEFNSEAYWALQVSSLSESVSFSEDLLRVATIELQKHQMTMFYDIAQYQASARSQGMPDAEAKTYAVNQYRDDIAALSAEIEANKQQLKVDRSNLYYAKLQLNHNKPGTPRQSQPVSFPSKTIVGY